jgi:hypothetical protein
MVLKVCKCGAWHKQRPCPDCQKKKERGKQARNKQLGRNTAAWQKFRAKVLARDGNRCVDCRGTNYLTAHRIGGGYHALGDMSKYVTLCSSCHPRRQRAEQEERERLGLTR